MDVDTNSVDKEIGNGVSMGGISSRAHAGEEEDVPMCECVLMFHQSFILFLADTSIEAPPSLLPPRHYCDITGLEV